MSMEDRFLKIERRQDQLEDQFRLMFKDVGLNTDVTKSTGGKVDAFSDRLSTIEKNMATIAAFVAAAKMAQAGGVVVRWVASTGANIVIMLTALHYLK